VAGPPLTSRSEVACVMKAVRAVANNAAAAMQRRVEEEKGSVVSLTQEWWTGQGRDKGVAQFQCGRMAPRVDRDSSSTLIRRGSEFS
jgi:hypothetical protein